MIDPTLHLVFRFPRSPSVCEFFSPSLYFMTLERVLVRLSCRMSPNLGLSGIFLIIGLGSQGFGKSIRDAVLFSCSFIFLLCEVSWAYWLCGLMSFIDFGQLNAGRRDTVPVPGSGPRRHHMSPLTPPMLTRWPKVPEEPIELTWTQPAAWSQDTLSATWIDPFL